MNLNTPITDILRLTDAREKALVRFGVKTIKDLLWHFPARYEELAERKILAETNENEKATFFGKILEIKLGKTWKKRTPICKAQFSDGTSSANLVWFHQPFVANMLKKDDAVAITGKISRKKENIYIANPIFEKINPNETETLTNELLPIYPETRGLSSRWFRFAIQKAMKKIIDSEEIQEFIPGYILNRYHLPSLKNALVYIHAPKEIKDAEAARKRFSFEEIFLIQLTRIRRRLNYEKENSFEINTSKKELEQFLNRLNFKLTSSQRRAIEYITKDFSKKSPMARLLEGDVGSGKTVVAAASAYLTINSGYQVAYMAPTEVLARQLFESFIQHFIGLNIKIGLITSSECRKFPSKVSPMESTHISKSQLLKWVISGEIGILIGTHAIIQEKVKFKNLALVIIDEQHRFGTSQRAKLAKKRAESNLSLAPHLLSMTATPIPRTLALTVYGDLDITLLDEMPPDRKEIITEIIPPDMRETAYEKIKEEVEENHQAFIICPRIEPRDPSKENLLSLNMKAVKEEAERLSKKIFPQYKIGALHGKMKLSDKEKTMADFIKGEIKILVATSVIEVGVNVPNATVIVIEGAERFGLAQLHQLRGRVRRSVHRPYCFIFTESKSLRTKERLKALETAKNGFELAEYDLQFRGTGALAGKNQWGLSDVGMDALRNLKMVEAARLEAQNILEKDSELKEHPLIKQKMEQLGFDIHFE